MNPNDIVAKVIAALDRCKIPFMVVGSFSSNVYGVERTTQDADFVMQLEPHSISELIRELGPDFKLDPQLGFETVTMTSRDIASHIDPLFKIELFLISDDAHDLERFARRQNKATPREPTSPPQPRRCHHHQTSMVKKRQTHQGHRRCKKCSRRPKPRQPRSPLHPPLDRSTRHPRPLRKTPRTNPDHLTPHIAVLSLFHQVDKCVLHGGAPDVVAFSCGWRLSGRKESGRKYAFVVEEF